MPEPNREKEIFEQALDIESPEERAAFIRQACGSDEALIQRIHALLKASETAPEFLPEESQRPSDATVGGLAVEGPGTLIGRYKLLEQIGEGGFGYVYMAEQLEPVKRHVALKIIKPGMDSKQVIGRFEAERQALALMDHPNIAQVFDAGATETGRPYFVMELVKGIPITKFCEERQLDLEARLKLFIQVCSAVQHAHQKGIIHRDLKPSNILVTLHGDQPVPKVIDFGIAKATQQPLTDKTVFTHFQQFLGTPAYMSPEQATLSGLDVDTRSDIYSLGVLLYELLTGSPPFDTKQLLSAGLDEMRRIIREKEPERPSTRIRKTTLSGLETPLAIRHSSLATDLDWIVMKCLEKDRMRRYETANGLAEDLRRHLDNEPVVARPPSRFYEFQKSVRRHKVGFAATAAVVTALCAGVLVSMQEASRARRSADLARGYAYAADMNLAHQALAKNHLAEAQEILDRYQPEPRQKDWRGWEWRYLWQQCHRQAFTTVCQMTNTIWSLSVSSDGKWLAVGEWDDGGLSIWDLHTGIAKAHLTAGDHKVNVCFSPVEPLLAYSVVEGPATNRQASVRFWKPGTGQKLPELPLGAECVGLAFSGDGQTLVTSTASPDNHLTLWQLAGLRKLATYPAPQDLVSEAIPFAVAGDLSVAAYGSPTIHLLDLQSGEERWQARAAKDHIMALAFSPDGKTLASSAGYYESSVRLWDVASGKGIGRLAGHGNWVGEMAFVEDGKGLVSASADGTVRLWDLRQLSNIPPPRVVGIHRDEVWRLALLPGTTKLVSGDRGGGVRIWDRANLRRQDVAFTLPDCAAWRFAADSRSVLMVRAGQVVRWTGDHFQRRQTLLNVNEMGKSEWQLFSPDGQRLAVGRADGRVEVWDLLQRTNISEFTAQGTPRGVAFLSNNQRLVVADLTGEYFHEWDVGTAREIGSWQSGGAGAYYTGAFAFSPDERYCVCLTKDGRSFLHDLVSDTDSHPRLNLRHAGDGAAFSPDGKLIAMESNDYATLQLWEADTFRELASIKTGGYTLDFSPDGRRLVLGGDSGAALWDVRTRRRVLTLETASKTYWCEFSPDGNLVGAKSSDGYLHIWRAPSWEEIEVAERAGGSSPGLGSAR